jgi:hypothetical protein
VIKRLWLVLSVLWALLSIVIVLTDSYMSPNIQRNMLFVGFAPFLIGPVVWRLGRFVVRGD